MRLLLIASCLSMLAGSATAGVSFGNASKLLEDCSSMTDPVPYTHCLGYITGVADALAYGAQIGSFKVCIPAETSEGEVQDVAISWLKDHPKAGDYSAVTVVAAALSQAFPCR